MADPRLCLNGASFILFPGWDIAAVAQGLISLTCLARSSTGLRKGSRPRQWSRLAERFQVAADHSVPTPSTRITKVREMWTTRTASNAVEFRDHEKTKTEPNYSF